METNTNISRRERKKQRKNSFKQIIGALFTTALALGLFYVGYIYFEVRLQLIEEETKAQVEKSLAEIQQANALNQQSLKSTLDAVLFEMEEIKHALSKADENLGMSTLAQESLTERIEALDKQLSELQRGLTILQEDYDAVN